MGPTGVTNLGKSSPLCPLHVIIINLFCAAPMTSLTTANSGHLHHHHHHHSMDIYNHIYTELAGGSNSPDGTGGMTGNLVHLLPPEMQEILSKGLVGDTAQLHVLQDAFISLESFFQLKTSIEEDPATAGRASGEDFYAENEEKKRKATAATNDPAKLREINKRKGKIQQIGQKLDEYRKL